VHLATYRDTDDLLDKIAFYLKRDELRDKIAAAGMAEAISKHTYRHRTACGPFRQDSVQTGS
jgi:spore maturation protein CgeB